MFGLVKKKSDQVFHHTRWKLDKLLGFQFSIEIHDIVENNFGLQILKISALTSISKDFLIHMYTYILNLLKMSYIFYPQSASGRQSLCHME